MIKMNYVGEPYNYSFGESQNYRAEMNIEMNEDCTLGDILDAVIALAKTATYSADIKAIASWVLSYADRYDKTEELFDYLGVQYREEE